MDVNVFYQTMDDLLHHEEWDHVEPYLTASLMQAREEEDYSTYIAICNEMIVYYRYTEQYEKAYPVSEDVLLLMEELQMDKTEDFARVLLNSAETFHAGGRYRDAYEQYMRVASVYAEFLEPDDLEYEKLYGIIAALLDALDETDQAVEMGLKALVIIRKQPKDQQETETKQEEAALLTTLGLLELKRTYLDEAEAYFKEALVIYEEVGAKNPTHNSCVLSGLGEIYFHRGQFGQALSYYDRACNQVKEYFGENESYAILSENCAAVCEQMGDLQKQEFYLERAGKIRKNQTE